MGHFLGDMPEALRLRLQRVLGLTYGHPAGIIELLCDLAEESRRIEADPERVAVLYLTLSDQEQREKLVHVLRHMVEADGGFGEGGAKVDWLARSFYVGC